VSQGAGSSGEDTPEIKKAGGGMERGRWIGSTGGVFDEVCVLSFIMLLDWMRFKKSAEYKGE